MLHVLTTSQLKFPPHCLVFVFVLTGADANPFISASILQVSRDLTTDSAGFLSLPPELGIFFVVNKTAKEKFNLVVWEAFFKARRDAVTEAQTDTAKELRVINRDGGAQQNVE